MPRLKTMPKQRAVKSEKSSNSNVLPKKTKVFMNNEVRGDELKDSLAECEKALGYSFKNDGLLRLALTHRSCSSKPKSNYERLEFLGDSVLGFVVAEHLFLECGDNEGRLTSEKQRLVSTQPLAEAAKAISLDKYVKISESLSNGAFLNGIPQTVCENVYEAIVAAIYLDGGLEQSKSFIKRTLLVNEKRSLKTKNYIVELQEYAQANKMGTPIYEFISQSGPDHDPLFTMAVNVGNKRIALGSGSTKKLADKQAAERALKKLRKGKSK